MLSAQCSISVTLRSPVSQLCEGCRPHGFLNEKTWEMKFLHLEVGTTEGHTGPPPIFPRGNVKVL